ncbi:hypothetical protein FJZ40_00010 [Candidatus Shapirobacteria bacterium]|nr:hypothetical protein [Candidatus Shapirobacteria bacterium]
MKLIFGEYKASYEKYYFPYQVWLLKEDKDSLEEIYNLGFLPIRNLPGVFYLSRSVRVSLEKFSPSSENRRVLRRTSDFNFEFMALDQFGYTSAVQKFCKDYMDKRFGKGQMSVADIKSVFRKGVYNRIFIGKKGKEEVGYALCLAAENLIQYAHAFYDLKFLSLNLGARMMLQAVMWGKENGKKYAYLGTCYEKSALYKTEFSGVEFFNGFRWSDNLEELKCLVERKSETYLFKDEDFRNKFYSQSLEEMFKHQ